METKDIPLTQLEMIEEFQCPGCMGCGPPSSCSSFQLSDEYGFHCKAHVPGTSITTANGLESVYLGLPKGFNKVGCAIAKGDQVSTHNIRMWEFKEAVAVGLFNKFNVPVWAVVKDGFLFVRTYLPRTNRTFIDIIKEATLDFLPKIPLTDVADIQDEID